MKLRCPDCDRELEPVVLEFGHVESCAACGGMAVNADVLRRAVDPEAVSRMWLRSETAPAEGRPCPACRRSMRELAASENGPRVDLCRTCLLVWLDRGEIERFPSGPEAAPARPLPEAAKTMLARVELLRLDRRREIEERNEENPQPQEGWKWIPMWLGLPVEVGGRPGLRAPVATRATAIAIVVVSLIAFARPEVLDALAFVSSDPFRGFGASLLTSFFVHGGLFHLLSNLYFLLVFGDDVEDDLGPALLGALLAAGTIVGDLAFAALTPDNDLPLVGASGGISAVLGYYVVRFPGREMLWILIPYRWVPAGRIHRTPAWALFAVWLVLQLGGAAFDRARGGGGIAHVAHLGGFAVGLALGAMRSLRPTGDR